MQNTISEEFSDFNNQAAVQPCDRPWSTGLFDCFSDKDTCFSAFFLPNGIQSLTLTEWKGTNFFLNYFFASTTLFYHETRLQYHLEGNACTDCLIGCCCGCCAIGRILRERKNRKAESTAIMK
ncbi:hypothetical protein ABK040_002566 [Willaertia magna]